MKPGRPSTSDGCAATHESPVLVAYPDGDSMRVARRIRAAREPWALQRCRRQTVWLVVLSAVLASNAATAPVFAQDGAWTVTTGDVRVVCRLTVGGSFEAKTSSLGGSLRAPSGPGEPMSGELVVDLNTLDTGIRLRNEHLRDRYLETAKGPGYAHAVLSSIRLNDVDLDSSAGRGTFTGTLLLHGIERPVAGDVELRQTGGLHRVRATFPLALPDFSIASPRYLGVGVRDDVVVNVTFHAIRGE
jgi:polyisoprenoid-binding protein YceI